MAAQGAPVLADVEAAAGAEQLAVMGGFHPTPEDGLPPGIATLVLLGPMQPGFWDHVTAAPEFADGTPDPLDRWSRRTIGGLACRFGGKAVFPFTGPPWRPFHAWALRTGRCWSSPVGLLVHDTAGLFASFRGALGLPVRLALPAAPATAPCADCPDRPCLSACPVGALNGAGYDLPACHGFLDTAAGGDCMAGGCAVRRACPVSQRHGRPARQSAWHMERFHSR